MNVAGLLGQLGSELFWVAIAAGFGAMLGAVLAVLSLQGRRVSAAALPLGLGLIPVALVALGRLAVLGWDDLDADGLKLATTTHGALPLVGLFVVAPVAALNWALLAFGGARGAPRRKGYAVLGALLVLLTAALAATSGFVGVNWLFSSLRGALYVGLGALVVVALLGGGEDGPDAGAGAALGYPLLVAVGEAAERGLVHLLILPQTAIVEADLWPLGVERLLEAVRPELPWSYAAIAAASAVAGVGMALSIRQGRGLSALAGVVWIALAFAVLWMADLGPERLDALGILCVRAPG